MYVCVCSNDERYVQGVGSVKSYTMVLYYSGQVLWETCCIYIYIKAIKFCIDSVVENCINRLATISLYMDFLNKTSS